MNLKSFFTTIILLFCFSLSSQASKVSSDVDADAMMQGKFKDALTDTRSGNHLTAFKEWVEYLELTEKYPHLADSDHLQTAYIALAQIHFNFQDYESALDFNNRGLALAEEQKDPQASIRFLHNMAGCHAELGDFQNAQDCISRMHSLSKTVGSPDCNYNYEFSMGYLSKKKKEYADAVRHYKNALAEIDKVKMDTAKRVYPYSELFSVYEACEQLDSALFYLLKYKQYADKPVLQKDCYKELMRIYAKLGDNKKCLDSQIAYFHLTDSVLNERDFIEIRNRYQGILKEKREGYINDLEVRLSRQTLVLFIILLALLFFGVVALLIWRQKQRLNSAYHDLYERNKQLLKMHEELVQARRRDTVQTAQKSILKKEAETPETSANPKEEDKEMTNVDVNEALLQKIQDVFDCTDEYLNAEFSLQSLAKLVESNTKYVSQTINDSLGCNFRAIVNEYRIKEAQRRMLDTEKYGNMTIQGIAESVGYKSPTNFITAFKKATGMTPSLFMKMAREGSR